MKRKISLVMILALLTLAMIFAISCNKPAEPPTDEEIWDEIMENMDNLASFTSEGTLEYEIYSGDLRTSGVAAFEEVMNNLGGDNFKHSLEMINSYSYRDISKYAYKEVSATSNVTQLYVDGLYYVIAEDNGRVVKNYKQMPVDEYLSTQTFVSIFLPEAESGVECEYSKEENGALSAVITITDKSSVNNFSSMFGLYAGVCDFEITEYVFAFKSNNGKYVDEMEMRCIYDLEENEDEKTPKMIFKSSYDDFDCAEEIVNQYNTEDFTKIEHNDVLTMLDEKIDAILSWEGAAFNLTENSVIKIGSNTISDESTESEIICGTLNGKKFLYSAKSGSTSGVLRYYDGEKTTYVGSSKNKTKMTDAEAGSFFLSGISQLDADFSDIESVEHNGNGLYKIKLNDSSFNIAKYSFENSGMKITDVSYVINVTVRDGVITDARSTVIYTYEYKGQTGTITMTNTVKW